MQLCLNFVLRALSALRINLRQLVISVLLANRVQMLWLNLSQ
jgi:hypothetical protein